MQLARELWNSRKLLWNLSKNDFKTKYAGSYLGIIWAFIQPIVTVMVYWFVFSVGMRQGEGDVYPFVLVLISGIVPWFFFSDAWNGATTSMMEYNYLVKKVVFKISILPIVKLISAFFVHLFFVMFSMLILALNGYPPSVYMLQLVYYGFALSVLVLGMSYATCAIVVFFRDLQQIINIVLQVGVWATPIMWQMAQFSKYSWSWIFKLNPLFYIVEGYRDSLLYHNWFWEKPRLTLYYWCFTLVAFLLGATIFRRLKVHFADIL